MNSQDIYNEKKREFNDKMTKYINNINKNNIYYKLKSTISELNEKRELYLRQFSSDTYFQNRYRGEVLSVNRGLEDDFYKSIEYEAILTASLQLIKKNNNNNNWLYIIFILNIWALILYILKEYYNYI
jgi:hypothetical protein